MSAAISHAVARPGYRIGRQQRLAIAADMEHDRATLKQRNHVVMVARYLTEGLFLVIVGRTFSYRVELANSIGNAGFFERPARAQVADLSWAKGGTQLKALMRTRAL